MPSQSASVIVPEIVTELQAIVGHDYVLTSAAERKFYSTDLSYI